MPPSKGCFYLFAAGSGSAPEGLMPRRESLWLGEPAADPEGAAGHYF